MTREQPEGNHDRVGNHLPAGVGRRKFIAVGGSVSAALLAGCTSDGTSTDDPDDGSGSDSDSGNMADFRLLISDMPADIGDFERLDVTFDTARIFEGGDEDEEDEEGTETESTEAESTATETEGTEDSTETEEMGTETDAEATETETEEDGETEEDTETEDDAGEDRGFYVLNLDDPTVDLTEVVGEKAMPVFDGELSEGRYQKMELAVSDVEGIVDGEEAEVKVPSEKLQLTKPFEVRADESVDFVFDINVVKRGQRNSYNLKPVISKSGVRGEDVEVEEVDEEETDEDEMDDAENGTDDDMDSEPDGTEESTETDDADSENGTSAGASGNETGE